MRWKAKQSKRSFESTFFEWRHLPLLFVIYNVYQIEYWNIGFRWPEKEDSRYGGPKKKKNIKSDFDPCWVSFVEQVQLSLRLETGFANQILINFYWNYI